jgi:hypothetical protein
MNLNEQITKIENDVENAKASIKKLKELLNQKQNKKWQPTYNQKYYIPDPTDFYFYSYSIYFGNDCEADKNRFDKQSKAGLILENQEEAIEKGKEMYYRYWLKSLSDITEEDWKDKSKEKWFAFWDYRNSSLQFDCTISCRKAGLIYFKRKESYCIFSYEKSNGKFKRWFTSLVNRNLQK